MCGRYGRRGDKQKIAEIFHVRGELHDVAFPVADYNIAPTSEQPIIRQSRDTGDREMVMARWGLIPFFTKNLADVKASPRSTHGPIRSRSRRPGGSR